MRSKLVGLVAGAALATAALGATSASAATEFGDGCAANDSTESSNKVTIFGLSAPGNPLPLAAPSSGVITKWKVNVIPTPGSLSQTLKVLRQTGGNTVQIIGEASANVTGGLNTFDTRMSVQAGDRLALFGPGEFGTLFCETGVPNTVIAGFLGGGGTVGSTVTFVQEPSTVRVPVSAVLEPDADNDGYGDETQDKCPQSAAAQAACPAVALSASATAKRGLANVLVTASSQAAVTATGTVKLGKGKTATLSGGTQVVVPGTIATFTMLFTAKLKAKLKTLSRKQSLRLKISVTAANVVGPPSVSTLNVKLKGQKKAKRKKPHQVKRPGVAAG